MPTYNNAINPKNERETGFALDLMPVRASEVKEAHTNTDSRVGGATNLRTGYVVVPTTDTAEARTIRLHEAMHAAHTSRKAKPADLLDQALEDGRLHRYCAKTVATSALGIPAPRRDELATCLRELHRMSHKPASELHERASLATFRALSMIHADTHIKPSHMVLLKRVCFLLGPHCYRDMLKALATLADSNGDTTKPVWTSARLAIAKYFAKDFTPKPSPEPTPSPLGSSSEDTSKPSGEPEPATGESSDDSEDESSPEASEASEDSEDSKPEDEDSEDSEAGSEDSEDSEDTEDESSEDTPSGDSSDGDAEPTADESEASEGSDTPESTPEIAPAIPDTPKKARPKKARPDEYTGDLTPTCDAEEYKRHQTSHPHTIFIRRLDMGINRVKLSMGRKAPLPVQAGSRINSARLASAMTTPGVRAFSRTINNGGYGTILIDASGSMCIPEKTLIEFVSHAPALTVAFYNAPNDHCTKGNIYIYAANGYRASFNGHSLRSSCPEYGGGNVIDYHAMAWLIKQPAPHYLVTDERWTGYFAHCGASANLCAKLKASKQLIVVPNLDAMTQIIRKRATGRP